MSRGSKKIEAGEGGQLKIGQVSQFDGAGGGPGDGWRGTVRGARARTIGCIINYCMNSRYI